MMAIKIKAHDRLSFNQKNGDFYMKKSLMFVTMLIMVLALAACSGNSAAAPTDDTSSNSSDAAAPSSTEAAAPAANNPGATGSGQSNPLTGEELYLVGIFKLEGTDNAVTAAQAATLLPLWQSLLSQSGTPTLTADQISSAGDQIKAALTSQQLDAITALNLTQKDLFTLMSEKGLAQRRSGAANGTQQAPNGTPQAPNGGPQDVNGTPQAPQGTLQAPNGTGGGPQGFNGTPDPSRLATLQAGGGGQGRGGMNNRMNEALINALIELLKTKS
jgi:hypothetical protein